MSRDNAEPVKQRGLTLIVIVFNNTSLRDSSVLYRFKVSGNGLQQQSQQQFGVFSALIHVYLHTLIYYYYSSYIMCIAQCLFEQRGSEKV